MKKNGKLWRFTKLRQVKYLNNIVEQDNRRIKRLVRLGLGFKIFYSARRTIAGYEIMAMVRKDKVATIPANDMPAQATFIANLFGMAACRRDYLGSPRLPSNFATEQLLRTGSKIRNDQTLTLGNMG